MAVVAAEELGRRLLGEVEESTLLELLTSLQDTYIKSTLNQSATSAYSELHSEPHPPAYPFLNIPTLDNLIASHHHNTASPQSKHHSEPYLPTIELTASSTGAGKTQLLYLLIAASVLPVRHGGKGAAAVVLDTDGRFDVERLADVCVGFMKQNIKQHEHAGGEVQPGIFDEEYVYEILRQSLTHVHIFRPTSLTSLLATMHALPGYLLGRLPPTSTLTPSNYNENLTSYPHRSHDRAISLLALDSASTFFWPTRMATETARATDAERSEREGNNINSTNNAAAAVMSIQEQQLLLPRLFRSLQTLLRCTFVYTSWTLSPQAPAQTHMQIQAHSVNSATTFVPGSTSGFPPAATMFLGSSLTLGPVLRILLSRKQVIRFAPGLSLENALRDREVRQGVVEKGVFEGWVVGGGERVGGQRFEMRITGEGVLVGYDDTGK